MSENSKNPETSGDPHRSEPQPEDLASREDLLLAYDRLSRERGAASVLMDEARWLLEAHKNSAGRGYSAEFRAGFKAAAGWVRSHAEIAGRPDVRPR